MAKRLTLRRNLKPDPPRRFLYKLGWTKEQFRYFRSRFARALMKMRVDHADHEIDVGYCLDSQVDSTPLTSTERMYADLKRMTVGVDLAGGDSVSALQRVMGSAAAQSFDRMMTNSLATQFAEMLSRPTIIERMRTLQQPSDAVRHAAQLRFRVPEGATLRFLPTEGVSSATGRMLHDSLIPEVLPPIETFTVLGTFGAVAGGQLFARHGRIYRKAAMPARGHNAWDLDTESPRNPNLIFDPEIVATLPTT